MKTTINLSDFRSAFYNAGRKEQFSYEALELIFDYFEELELGTGEEIELDVISICCDYSEDTPEEIAENYDIDITDMDDDEVKDAVLEYLNDNTFVVGETDTSIVYQQF